VAFSPDGQLVVTGSMDGTARVFESNSGREVTRLAHQDPVLSVAFTPDGRRLGIASGSAVNMSPWKPEDIISYVCRHLSFNLSREDWQRYLPREPYRKTCPNLPEPPEPQTK
jgi:WD40 repeat protein